MKGDRKWSTLSDCATPHNTTAMGKSKRMVKWRLPSLHRSNSNGDGVGEGGAGTYHNFELDDKILATLDCSSSSSSCALPKRPAFKTRCRFWRKSKVSTTGSNITCPKPTTTTRTMMTTNIGTFNSSQNAKSCYKPLLCSEQPQRQQRQQRHHRHPVVARVRPATATTAWTKSATTKHSRAASFFSLPIKRHRQQAPIPTQQLRNKLTYSVIACCSGWRPSKCCPPFFKRFISHFRYLRCCYTFPYQYCCCKNSNNIVVVDDDDIDAKIAAYIHEFQQQQLSASANAICVDSHDFAWLRAAYFSPTDTELPLPVTINTSNQLNHTVYQHFLTPHHHNHHYHYNRNKRQTSLHYNGTASIQHHHLRSSGKRRIWTWDDSLRSNSDRFLKTLEEEEEWDDVAENSTKVVKEVDSDSDTSETNYLCPEAKRTVLLESPSIHCNLREALLWMLPVMLCAVEIGGMFN